MLLKGLYGVAQQAVARYPRPYLVVAIDPVNFEKPYTEALEGVSTVLKSTPPSPKGEKRLTPDAGLSSHHRHHRQPARTRHTCTCACQRSCRCYTELV